MFDDWQNSRNQNKTGDLQFFLSQMKGKNRKKQVKIY